MESFVLGNLKILCEPSADGLVFHWTGSSDNRELIQALEPYYAKILESAAGKTATLDFRQLTSMNSSTVPAIIGWVKFYGENSVPTKVIYNKISNWQKSSFRLLGTMSAHLKLVTVEGV